MTANPHGISAEDAEDIAIRAFSFLAVDEDRMARFFDLTGFDPVRIATTARDPSFLPGILDYLLADEALLLTYCANAQLDPVRVAAAHRALHRRSAARRGSQPAGIVP